MEWVGEEAVKWWLKPRYAVAWTNEHNPWQVLWHSTHRNLSDARRTIDSFIMFNYAATMKQPVTMYGIWDYRHKRIIEVHSL